MSEDTAEKWDEVFFVFEVLMLFLQIPINKGHNTNSFEDTIDV